MIANEGDAREYGTEDEAGYYLDEARVANLAADMGISITTGLYSQAQLGRLKVRVHPDHGARGRNDWRRYAFNTSGKSNV